MANPSTFYQNAIFWIEVDKIKPNPFQPRREFDEAALKALADSIRQYGVLQALVVTRKENHLPDGGMKVEYELIAGERRLRASRIAGLAQVPVLIRAGHDNDLMKLELAIIENIQREDLNAVDRAKAFDQLVKEFGFKHTTIAEKVGKSREYVSNTLRILALPETILQALSEGKISEGHTRPLLMLTDRPLEQETLYKEIIFKKLNVREAELIARKIAVDRARKKERMIDPALIELEGQLQESLGTRVHIEKTENGGKVHIDFFNNDDLMALINLLQVKAEENIPNSSMDAFDKFANNVEGTASGLENMPDQPVSSEMVSQPLIPSTPSLAPAASAPVKEDDEDIYSVKNFSI